MKDATHDQPRKSNAVRYEMVFVGFILLSCGWLTSKAIRLAEQGLMHIYFDTHRLPLLTQWALHGGPMITRVYPVLGLAVLSLRWRYPQTAWLTWMTLGLVAIASAVVGFALVLPFSSTTWELLGK